MCALDQRNIQIIRPETVSKPQLLGLIYLSLKYSGLYCITLSVKVKEKRNRNSLNMGSTEAIYAPVKGHTTRGYNSITRPYLCSFKSASVIQP